MRNTRVDDVVFDEKGNPCNVISVVQNRESPIYLMEFSDGSNIRADESQIWITTARRIGEGKKGSNRLPKLLKRQIGNGIYAFFVIHNKVHHVCAWDDTERDMKFKCKLDEILLKRPLRRSHESSRTTTEVLLTLSVHSPSNMEAGRVERNHRIPNSAPLNLPEKSLPIDPYALGVWLGDGHKAASRITLHKDDVSILDEIMKSGLLVSATEVKGRPNLLLATIGLLDTSLCCRRGHLWSEWESQTTRKRCLKCEQMTDYARRHNLQTPPITNLSLQDSSGKKDFSPTKESRPDT